MSEQETQLFATDEQLAQRVRAVASELRVVTSRRRAFELAGELDAIARILDPHDEQAGAS